MRNRCGLLLFMSLATSLSGCAATSKLGSGAGRVPSEAWNQAPAPPQRTIASTVPTDMPLAADAPNAKPAGLARYFPGFQRIQPEPPKVVARYRPTWFGLRPNPALKSAQPTSYMTDTRAGLNQPVGEQPASLPVALQVPTPKPTADRSVRPATVEQPIHETKPTSAVDGSAINEPRPTTAPTPAPATLSDLGGKPSKPGEEEANPLPPALEPGQAPPQLAGKMPEVPAIDPLQDPRPNDVETTPAVREAQGPTPGPSNSTTDEKALKAVTEPSTPELPDPTVQASYVGALVAQQAVGMKKLSECKIFASPQSPPRAVVKPTSQAVPTSLSKPSPQSSTGASPQTCETPAGSTGWKRPCLRRLVRRVGKLGEFANPPTAAPH